MFVNCFWLVGLSLLGVISSDLLLLQLLLLLKLFKYGKFSWLTLKFVKMPLPNDLRWVFSFLLNLYNAIDEPAKVADLGVLLNLFAIKALVFRLSNRWEDLRLLTNDAVDSWCKLVDLIDGSDADETATDVDAAAASAATADAAVALICSCLLVCGVLVRVDDEQGDCNTLSCRLASCRFWLIGVCGCWSAARLNELSSSNSLSCFS
jgi:hypothetical protein